MSKQSEAKTNQNYRAKPEWPECWRCKWFTMDLIPEQWYMQEKNLRCTLGGFAVAKLGTCDKWEEKE